MLDMFQGLKKGLVVAKKLDYWLIVNGGWASCKYRGLTKFLKLYFKETAIFKKKSFLWLVTFLLLSQGVLVPVLI